MRNVMARLDGVSVCQTRQRTSESMARISCHESDADDSMLRMSTPSTQDPRNSPGPGRVAAAVGAGFLQQGRRRSMSASCHRGCV